MTTIAELIDAGDVAVEVEEIFTFDRAPEAHRRGEGGHTRGKLVLRVASSS
ncbi:zinc-binding dehydrogenase [Kribbella sp. NPDC050241]|uniref:zinc-binding dehydrogenase n=1 Tax=Kribbella sp. NPDC050241 TaxID=3364115 RepID=UPI0037B93509